MYFRVDEMSGYAFDLHGLSVSKLERLSGGKTFKDQVSEVFGILYGKRLVGHSISSDIRALWNEFERAGHEFPPIRQFCTMAHFAPVLNIRTEGQRRPKNPNLSELCKHLGVLPETVHDAVSEFFEANTHIHDARYDVCATYLCIRAATRAGMVRGLFPGEE
jgi:DNA polymerase III epsilon subunit-like protein